MKTQDEIVDAKMQSKIEKFIKEIAYMPMSDHASTLMAKRLKITVDKFNDMRLKYSGDDESETIIYQFKKKGLSVKIKDSHLVYNIEEYANSGRFLHYEMESYSSSDGLHLQIAIDLENELGAIYDIYRPKIELTPIYMWRSNNFSYVGILLFGEWPVIIETKANSKWLRMFCSEYDNEETLLEFVNRFKNTDSLKTLCSVVDATQLLNAKIAVGSCIGESDDSAIY